MSDITPTLSVLSMTPPPPTTRGCLSKAVYEEIAMRGCITPGVVRTEMGLRSPVGSDGLWTPGHEEEEIEITTQNLSSFLAPAIAGLLERIAGGSDGEDSVFSWEAAPMSLSDYVQRIADYSCLTMAPYISAVMLIDRLDAKHPGIIGRKNIHKLFLTALSIAHKAIEEYQLLNTTIATIGAIDLKSLRACEGEFVTLLDWEVGINSDVFSNYMELIHAEAGIPTACAGNIGFLGH